MSGSERTPLFLGHIVDAIDRIQTYVRDLDRANFLTNTLVQDAVVRNLEIVGEASNNIRKHDPLFIAAHPDVPWNDAVGNRNSLSHGYFDVDFELVWTTIHNDLPRMRSKVHAMLASY